MFWHLYDSNSHAFAVKLSPQLSAEVYLFAPYHAFWRPECPAASVHYVYLEAYEQELIFHNPVDGRS